ncbi:MAG: hypothetical protein JTT11_05095 [Candidatus Brockarchaeota archaeon]|nr:hypothetical protein [Candidatus Brockarchaeota archaeon]
MRSKAAKKRMPPNSGSSKVITIALVATALALTVASMHWIQKLVFDLPFTESIVIEKMWASASRDKIFVHLTLVNKGNVPVQLDSILINGEPLNNYRGASQGEFYTGLIIHVGESRSGTISIPYEPPLREGMIMKFDIVTSTDNHYVFFITIPSKPS